MGFLSIEEGPVLRMDKEDHKDVSSTGSGGDAIMWRYRQAMLIREGKFLDAMKMDIEEIRDMFGDKYQEGIEQMLTYVEKNPRILRLCGNSTATIQKLRYATRSRAQRWWAMSHLR